MMFLTYSLSNNCEWLSTTSGIGRLRSTFTQPRKLSLPLKWVGTIFLSLQITSLWLVESHKAVLDEQSFIIAKCQILVHELLLNLPLCIGFLTFLKLYQFGSQIKFLLLEYFWFLLNYLIVYWATSLVFGSNEPILVLLLALCLPSLLQLSIFSIFQSL